MNASPQIENFFSNVIQTRLSRDWDGFRHGQVSDAPPFGPSIFIEIAEILV